MYIQNRRDSSKFKGFGSHPILCLTESIVLCNRLSYTNRCALEKGKNEENHDISIVN